MRLPRVFDRRRRRYEKLVTERLDGVLDAAGEARLQQLLDSDEALAVEARELDAVTALLRAEPLVEPPRSFALPYAPARVPAPPHRGPLRWMQAATATAAVVLVTLIGVDLVVTPAAVSEAPESSTATAEQAPAASQAAPPPDAPAIDSAFADGAGQDKVQPFPLTRSLAPEPEPAPAPGRSALDWAQLGFALATAALALGVALVSWRAARSRA